MMKRMWMSFGLVIALAVTGVSAVAVADTISANAQTDLKAQLSRVRMRFASKKSQIRRIEKVVYATSQAFQEKVDALEQQRRQLYLAAEPSLKKLYDELDAFEKEVKSLEEKMVIPAKKGDVEP